MLGKSVALHFEGVYQNCKVYVNGKLAGSHRYGYTAFDVDISDFAESGENNVRVEVDNSLEPNCRWYSGSGLYRPGCICSSGSRITFRKYIWKRFRSIPQKCGWT